MKIGLIGTGKMGSALLGGLFDAGLCAPEEVTAFDAHAPTLEACCNRFAIRGAKSNEDVIQESEVVLLCLKPQDCEAALRELPDSIPSRLLISIAAGVTIDSLRKWTSPGHRIIRVMPNTPALIGKGASGFAAADGTPEEDRATARKILDSVGIALEVSESQLDAVTGLSGSGPAYVFTIIEALADGAVRQGLPKALALELAAQTVAGAAEMALASDLHPAQLRDQVTSPGGTTIAGLHAMEAGGLRAALMDGVIAATERSRALGRTSS